MSQNIGNFQEPYLCHYSLLAAQNKILLELLKVLLSSKNMNNCSHPHQNNFMDNNLLNMRIYDQLNLGDSKSQNLPSKSQIPVNQPNLANFLNMMNIQNLLTANMHQPLDQTSTIQKSMLSLPRVSPEPLNTKNAQIMKAMQYLLLNKPEYKSQTIASNMPVKMESDNIVVDEVNKKIHL